ncbi:MAG: nucleotidyltransferase domain-containing protein [Candidatus Diapherotrites archaeon]
MFLSKLFSSKERLKVIGFLFFNSATEIKVRETARKTGTSPFLVSGTIKLLQKEGIVKKNKIDLLNPKVKAIKIILNLGEIHSINLLEKTRRAFPDCKGIGLYGSWAKGLNYSDSDLDLWVKTEKKETEKISRIVKEKLKTDASVLLLSEKKLEELREKDFVFYSELHNSFVLWGEGI